MSTPQGWLAAAVLWGGCAAPTPEATALPSAHATVLPAAPEPTLLALPPPPASTRRPLTALGHACRDRRYPALAGSWAVGCGPSGLLDRAVELNTGRIVELAEPTEVAGLGDGTIVAARVAPGLWTLPEPRPVTTPVLTTLPPIAPPAIHGPMVAVSLEGRVGMASTGAASLWTREAAPLPWFPPAMHDQRMVWVDGRDQAQSGLDLWSWEPHGGPPHPLVVRPGDQRHPALSAERLAWLDDEGVWLQDRTNGELWLHPADTGFRAGLTLWHTVACWEERAGDDIDVRCSDGLEAAGPGDQGWPSRWGPWLLIRQEGTPWLITAAPPTTEPA